MRCFTTALLLGSAAMQVLAQTRIDLRTQTRDVDFSAAASTRPAKTGTNLPATCAVGELFFKSNATGGRNLYGCTEANAWKELTGAMPASGCGLMGCETGLCAVDSSLIPSYTGTLNSGSLIVGAGESFVRALNAGSAGQVLISNGPQMEPSWQTVPMVVGHQALSNLDYASSGHTGFQPELGYVPEHRLNFTAPLERNGDTISCPTCGSAPGATAAYAENFTGQTVLTIPGTVHALGSADVRVTVFETSNGRKVVEADSVAVDAATGDVTVTFAVPQSGRVVLE